MLYFLERRRLYKILMLNSPEWCDGWVAISKTLTAPGIGATKTFGEYIVYPAKRSKFKEDEFYYSDRWKEVCRLNGNDFDSPFNEYFSNFFITKPDLLILPYYVIYSPSLKYGGKYIPIKPIFNADDLKCIEQIEILANEDVIRELKESAEEMKTGPVGGPVYQVHISSISELAKRAKEITFFARFAGITCQRYTGVFPYLERLRSGALTWYLLFRHNVWDADITITGITFNSEYAEGGAKWNTFIVRKVLSDVYHGEIT